MQLCGMDITRHYYRLKPMIPRPLQLALRRWLALRQRRAASAVWPIDHEAGRSPAGWPGWPGGKRFALVLTHDVDTMFGHGQCARLMELETALGFRSSFFFVGGAYPVSSELRSLLETNGFETGVHGYLHDRSIIESRESFLNQAALINDCLKSWNAVGFRAPCMYHNLEWYRDLDILYDASTFDTDPFEPDPSGMRTIFPFRVAGAGERGGYIELPYTLPQDFTLFVLLQERDIELWKRKLAWIADRGGMALVTTHPDYMNFEQRHGMQQYPARYYEQFLMHVAERYGGEYWHPLPREMARHWAAWQGEPADSSIFQKETGMMCEPASAVAGASAMANQTAIGARPLVTSVAEPRRQETRRAPI